MGSPAAERHAPEPPRAPAPGPSAPGPSAPPPAAPGEAAARRTPAAGATSSAAGQPSADSLRENWGSVLEEVKQERRVAWILLSNASVLSLQDGVLTLRFARDGDLKAFSTSGHDVILKKVLNSAFGLNVTVRGVVGGGAGSGATSAQPGSGPRSAGQGTRPGGAGGGPRGPGGAGGSGGTGTGAAGQRGSAAPGFGSPGSGAPGFGTPGSGAPGSGAPGFGAPGFGGRRNEPLDDLPPEPDEMPDEMPSDDMAAGGTELTGMELIQRELGGQVIGEIEE